MKEEYEEIYKGFSGEKWRENIDVADFIRENYKEYRGDDSVLSPI